MTHPIIATGQFNFTHHQDPNLRALSSHFSNMAEGIDKMLPDSAEKTLALRKLWEAKNYAVMALVIARDSAGAAPASAHSS